LLFCSKWCSASQLGLMYSLARKCRNKTNATFTPSPQKRRVRDSNRKYINGSSQSHVVLKMQNRSIRYNNKNLKRAFCILTLQESKIQNHVFKSVLIIHKEQLLITTLHLQNHNSSDVSLNTKLTALANQTNQVQRVRIHMYVHNPHFHSRNTPSKKQSIIEPDYY
jgi:hypothetical protein